MAIRALRIRSLAAITTHPFTSTGANRKPSMSLQMTSIGSICPPPELASRPDSIDSPAVDPVYRTKRKCVFQEGLEAPSFCPVLSAAAQGFGQVRSRPPLQNELRLCKGQGEYVPCNPERKIFSHSYLLRCCSQFRPEQQKAPTPVPWCRSHQHL
jgi:hypothetical protein